MGQALLISGFIVMIFVQDLTLGICTELVELLGVHKFIIKTMLPHTSSLLNLYLVLARPICRIFEMSLRLHQMLADLFIDHPIMMPLCNVGVHFC